MDIFLAPQSLAAAAILLLLAGLSDNLGDRAVVLLINRISPLAFVLTLLASTLLFAAGAILWIAGAWLAATELFGVKETFAHFLIVLSFAYAPFLLGAVALLPLLGPVIHWFLRLMSFLLGLVLLVVLGLPPWQALLSTAGGALLVFGANWIFSEPAAGVAQWVWATLAGRPRPLRTHLSQTIPGYAPGPARGGNDGGQVRK